MGKLNSKANGSPKQGLRKPDLNRHACQCVICSHEQREDIESAFIAWRSPAVIAAEYGLRDRATVYRHATATGLFEKRRKNVRAALEKLIEQAGDVEATAAAVVAAIQAYTKINSAGEWVDRTETISLHELFDRMNSSELDTYAKTGQLPPWFRGVLGATPVHSQGAATDGN